MAGRSTPTAPGKSEERELFERCRDGLPAWFDDNIDSSCLDAPPDGSVAAFGTSDGRVFASTDMGASWMKTTEGRVKLTVYEGGTQGDERTVIRYMRPEVDQLNASLLTSPGLAYIDDGFNVFGIPFFFASDAEARYVREKLTPVLSKRLEAKGFQLIHWGNAGWVQLFSKTPIKTLADVKKVKLFTSEGDDRMKQWYSANGFTPGSDAR